MRFLLKDKKGFTLVELLVVIAVIGILTTVIYEIFQTTQRYNHAIELVNTQQSMANDVMYRLRVELADAAESEAFDPTVNPEKMDFSDSANDDYYYIVQNNQDSDGDGIIDGGFMMYGFDSSGARDTNPTYFGNASTRDPDYYTNVVFTTDSSGHSKIEVQIINPDDPSGTPPYVLSSDISLRSVAADGASCSAIRFKRIL